MHGKKYFWGIMAILVYGPRQFLHLQLQFLYLDQVNFVDVFVEHHGKLGYMQHGDFTLILPSWKICTEFAIMTKLHTFLPLISFV